MKYLKFNLFIYLQNEINEEDLAMLIIGSGKPIDSKDCSKIVVKIDGLDKEIWGGILKLSTMER